VSNGKTVEWKKARTANYYHETTKGTKNTKIGYEYFVFFVPSWLDAKALNGQLIGTREILVFEQALRKQRPEAR
jgi:hypothetical protein